MNESASPTKFERFLEYVRANEVTLRPWQEKAAHNLLSAFEEQGPYATGKSFLMLWILKFLDDQYHP